LQLRQVAHFNRSCRCAKPGRGVQQGAASIPARSLRSTGALFGFDLISGEAITKHPLKMKRKPCKHQNSKNDNQSQEYKQVILFNILRK
jgi:hypothetical protein